MEAVNVQKSNVLVKILDLNSHNEKILLLLLLLSF